MWEFWVLSNWLRNRPRIKIKAAAFCSGLTLGRDRRSWKQKWSDRILGSVYVLPDHLIRKSGGTFDHLSALRTIRTDSTVIMDIYLWRNIYHCLELFVCPRFSSLIFFYPEWCWLYVENKKSLSSRNVKTLWPPEEVNTVTDFLFPCVSGCNQIENVSMELHFTEAGWMILNCKYVPVMVVSVSWIIKGYLAMNKWLTPPAPCPDAQVDAANKTPWGLQDKFVPLKLLQSIHEDYYKYSMKRIKSNNKEES